MGDHSEAINASSDEVNFDHILEGWLEASVNFHAYYSKLVTYVNQEELDHHGSETLYVGQCPKRQLTTLLDRMRLELEKLIQDMDQLEPLYQLPTQKEYKKLAVHARRLNRLTHQAQTRLHLIRQPTS